MPRRNPVPFARKDLSQQASALWRSFLKARQRAVAMLQPQFYKMYDMAVTVEGAPCKATAPSEHLVARTDR